MNYGPSNIFRQLNKGTDYIQNSYNVSDGVTKPTPTLIFKGVVIDVDFDAIKSTTYASAVPPFSVFAKIIGMDDDVIDPTDQETKVYYPPLFPMHTICIPEIGEEVLILKENSEFSSRGYYVGRINDSSPLNISYARDYVGINAPETDNRYRYGFSFDVKDLRKNQAHKMPSSVESNVSIPMTYGDVVQQGRTKTYVRHSFNRNNKKGVLEQGIRMDGQLISRGIVNSFDYTSVPTSTYAIGSNGEAVTQNDMNRSVDPSIGETKTKTIHLVDSSIQRLGNYSYQSYYGHKQTNQIDGEDKSMIVNIAEEIYNISSRNVAGVLYRQVLGEKLVTQQQQSYNLIKEMMNTVSEFASTTQVLLDAFLEHTHALPKIDLNLEKEIKSRDLYRTRTKVKPQGSKTITVPAYTTKVQTGTTWSKNSLGHAVGTPTYDIITHPSRTVTVQEPPKIVPGRMRSRNITQKINFEAIIGGEDNPRFTAPVETDRSSPSDSLPDSAHQNLEKTELGLKTGVVDSNLEDVISKVDQQRERLSKLALKVNQFLSKNQFVN